MQNVSTNLFYLIDFKYKDVYSILEPIYVKNRPVVRLALKLILEGAADSRRVRQCGNEVHLDV